MKIEIVEGCIGDIFEVDGKNILDCTLEELKDALDKATKYALSIADESKMYALQEAIRTLTEDFGRYESPDEPCECCGDFIDTYTLEL